MFKDHTNRTSHKMMLLEECIDDYTAVKSIAKNLITQFDTFSTEEKNLIELNMNLRQFMFHLNEEIKAIKNKKRSYQDFFKSLLFFRRHIDKLKDEFLDGKRENVNPDDKEMYRVLAIYTQDYYNCHFEKYYSKFGCKRPFIDKFYRDYSLQNFPANLLKLFNKIAKEDEYDYYFCLLRGGLPYTLLLNILGLNENKIKYIVIGNRTGSHFDHRYILDLIDFNENSITRKKILIIDNNLATGLTLKKAFKKIMSYHPLNVSVLLDYFIHDISQISTENIRDKLKIDIHKIWVARDSGNPKLSDPEIIKLKHEVLNKAKIRLQ